MINKIVKLLPNSLKGCEISIINSGASKRDYFRLNKNGQSSILMDSKKESNQFFNFLKVYKLISKTKISIPKIYNVDLKNKIIILEDFGKLRFDKILDSYDLKYLLSIAVDSLIELKNEIIFDQNYRLPVYDYKTFENEISEFVNYFYPYYQKKKMPLNIKKEFFNYWQDHYNSLDLNFTSFVHKDFNLNNLIYLPNQKKHYKCGIIDFQNSFWGEDCWDLFSLLEDSRIYFDDQHNEFFINYYCSKTNQKKYINFYLEKYHFFNCSRQTRLLGRWIKLAVTFKQKYYLRFIKVTNKRLIKSLRMPFMVKLKNFYNKLIPDLYEF